MNGIVLLCRTSTAFPRSPSSPPRSSPPESCLSTIQPKLFIPQNPRSNTSDPPPSLNISRIVAECHYSLIDNKNAAEMWKILKDRFQDIAPMSISDIIRKVSSKKMTDFETTSLYCAEYESALNKIKEMLDDKAKVDVHTVEFMLQGMMLGNTTDVYSPLIAQLRRDWTHETTNLSEAMKTIVAYSVNMKNTNALHISTPDSRGRAPLGTCTFSECVERKNTRHWPDTCWQKFPQLKRHRSSLESGRANKQKTTSSETKADLPHTSPNIPTASSWLTQVMATRLQKLKSEQELVVIGQRCRYARMQPQTHVH